MTLPVVLTGSYRHESVYAQVTGITSFPDRRKAGSGKQTLSEGVSRFLYGSVRVSVDSIVSYLMGWLVIIPYIRTPRSVRC